MFRVESKKVVVEAMTSVRVEEENLKFPQESNAFRRMD